MNTTIKVGSLSARKRGVLAREKCPDLTGQLNPKSHNLKGDAQFAVFMKREKALRVAVQSSVGKVLSVHISSRRTRLSVYVARSYEGAI